ncbi:Histidine kinase [Pedobacter westerhofensis]|uniref:Histidine kinase n=1 Tax=Pedobacter westerhofensis TaxID=425512 RepID=A0A521FKK5_9SPHI|nr:histidine kinase [Pedobacter westerhofensis]SMO96140.1 Histidine kinase [Pedobacter westerhofensis]
MFKAYQIKWCLILAGIFAISTLFLRQSSPVSVPLWEYLDYTLRLTFYMTACWVIHAYFLLHKTTYLSNSARLIISNLIAILMVVSLNRFVSYLLPDNHFIDPPILLNSLRNILHAFFGGFIVSVICYSAFYSIHTNLALQTSKLENEILEQAHLRAQLLSLQQQISPHFLFNSLSTLNAIAPDQHTRSYIVQLAAVYRYVLNFNEHYLTPLKDELIFIKSYLYIMNERFDKALQVKIDISEHHLKMMIPPLSLQLLVENAIKHNMFTLQQPLHITIKTDGSPALIVENDHRPKKVLEANTGTGTGLKNISERYRLLGNTTISVSKENSKFCVSLPLLQK